MNRQQAKDNIARLRYEIKTSREANQNMRRMIAHLKSQPMGCTDPIRRLKLQCSINERLALIRDRQQAIEDCKVYL
jgi:hypothetical protein